MIHQFRDKKQIYRKRKLIKNFIFLIIFLALAMGGVFAYSNGLIHFIGRPIWKIQSEITNNLQNIGYLARTKAGVFKENENLLVENRDLKLAMIDYQILKDENTLLKESLNRILPDKNFILSTILTKPNYSPYDTIIIDIGLDSNITVGNKVYSNSLVPLGKISVVYSNTALVTLFTNPGEITGGMIDISNANIELVGRGGGNFETTIPIDLPFTKGTLVYLPNISSEIVAIMEDVISKPNDPIKKVLLTSPVNVQNLKSVLVKRD